MTVRVFVGCAPNHEDAESQAVLEWSIRKHASEPVEITWMKLSNDPESPFHGWATERWATPFSGFRWAVPALCNYQGRAIYTDSDVMFMDDIAKLFHADLEPGKAVYARGSSRLCVSLWDCEAVADLMIPFEELRQRSDNHAAMRGIFSRNSGVVQRFDRSVANWNCLDGEREDDLRAPHIKAIHYTSMAHQPQLSRALRRLERAGIKHWFDGKPTRHWRSDVTHLFEHLLAHAAANGYTVDRYTQDPIFGDYAKHSVAALQGEVPAWAQ